MEDLASSYNDKEKVTAAKIYTHPFFNQSETENKTPIDERIKHRVTQLKSAEYIRLSKRCAYQQNR